jgi:2-methylcitrate dehydratase PrpD
VRAGRFVVGIKFEDLPEDVVYETKRVLLDSIGCAIAGITSDKGKISIQLARRLGGPPESSIIGIGDKVSCSNAAFANGELINALDYDAIYHIPPFVIPPCWQWRKC